MTVRVLHLLFDPLLLLVKKSDGFFGGASFSSSIVKELFVYPVIGENSMDFFFFIAPLYPFPLIFGADPFFPDMMLSNCLNRYM